MSLRIRCEVLKAIAILDNATSESVSKMLPDLEPKQIQKAIYQLLTQDRIFKTGKEKRTGSVGRARFIYVANENWEPAKKKNSTQKAGRKSHTESLRTDGDGAMQIIRFRDRKIRLLIDLIDKVGGSQRDLLIGILADFGHKYKK